MLFRQVCAAVKTTASGFLDCLGIRRLLKFNPPPASIRGPGLVLGEVLLPVFCLYLAVGFQAKAVKMDKPFGSLVVEGVGFGVRCKFFVVKRPG